MTTFFRQEVKCANCHKSSEHQALGSTNAFGSPDLDLRPPEMQRSTMSAWLQQCPHCGYVAPKLSKGTDDMAAVSQSDYRASLSDQRFPELARRFLAHALLLVSSEPDSAAHSRLSAAWVCDDLGKSDLAVECRRLAAECLAKLRPFADDEQGVSQGAIFVDVLRRAGQWEQAEAECAALLACKNAKEILRQVLEYQSRLIGEHDKDAHRVDECVR